MSYYLTCLNSVTRIPLKTNETWLLITDPSAVLMEANHAWAISDKSLIQHATVKVWESEKTWCGVWSCFDCTGLLVVTSLGVHCTCIYLLGTPHYPWQFFYMIRFLHLFSSNRWARTKGQVRVKYLPSSVRTEEHIQIVWLWALSLLYPVHEKAFNEIKCFHNKYINRWNHYMISLAIKFINATRNIRAAPWQRSWVMLSRIGLTLSVSLSGMNWDTVRTPGLLIEHQCLWTGQMNTNIYSHVCVC